MNHNSALFLKFFGFFCVLFLCIAIANRGPVDNDYLNYYYFYVDSFGLSEIIFGDKALYRDSDQIYFLIISLFRELDFNFINFLFLTTLLSVGLKYYAARAYCDVGSSLLILFLWLSFNLFVFEAMQIRYALAMGFLFYSFGVANVYKRTLLLAIGFGIHMGTLVLLPVFLFFKVNFNHGKVIRNLFILFLFFIVFRWVDYSFIPRFFELFGNSTLSYLSGKLAGYLMQQDTTLSPITMIRYFILVTIYTYGANKLAPQDNVIYNYTYITLLLLSATSGFSVFFARLLPVVEFLCFILLFKDVLPALNYKYRINYILGGGVLFFSIINSALSLYILIENGSFKL